MRKAALLCGAFSFAVFVSFYLLPESVLLPAAGVCTLLSLLTLFLPRGKSRTRAHLALLGAAIGLLLPFSCRSIFSPHPRTRSRGKSV